MLLPERFREAEMAGVVVFHVKKSSWTDILFYHDMFLFNPDMLRK